MRQHAAYHLQHDPLALHPAPCGLCGVHSAVQYGGEDLGCAAWLEKKAGTFKPHHICKVGGAVSYSHGCAKKYSKGQPSTNHLIQCPECPLKPMLQYFWKYRCMQEHWERMHATITMPASLVADLQIGADERAELKKFKTASAASQTKKRRRSAAAAAPGVAANKARQQQSAQRWNTGPR
mmetsp:Transcript_27726/g.98786  ORF Transcript_27726/g.98786 Transcript_27726/m.98786 type:complete len:180 (+) Transcript_27726:658-1197(+)